MPGWYFVTICTYKNYLLFGNIINGGMDLNDVGEIARQCWLDIPNHFANVQLDEFIIMPNHVHGIINICDENVGANNHSPLPNNTPFKSPSKTIGSMVRGFKIGVTKWIRKNTDSYHVWQRNYYEHVIRDESELKPIRTYIIHNPLK